MEFNKKGILERAKASTQETSVTAVSFEDSLALASIPFLLNSIMLKIYSLLLIIQDVIKDK